MPTSFGPPGMSSAIETYQFTATSHGRTRDTVPSVMVSYDVSPIHAHVVEATTPLADFLISMCAIIGGAVSSLASSTACSSRPPPRSSAQ